MGFIFSSCRKGNKEHENGNQQESQGDSGKENKAFQYETKELDTKTEVKPLDKTENAPEIEDIDPIIVKDDDELPSMKDDQ